MKAYDLAPDHIVNRATRMMETYHPDLAKIELKLDILIAKSDNGPAVAVGGYPALACIRILNIKDRLKGNGDAEITIDVDAYEEMSSAQQDALIDHELAHLILCKDDDGFVKLDDVGRPKLKMRKHDYQLGWFREIAMRHGKDSVEVSQARILWNQDGQAFFPALTGGHED